MIANRPILPLFSRLPLLCLLAVSTVRVKSYGLGLKERVKGLGYRA